MSYKIILEAFAYVTRMAWSDKKKLFTRQKAK
jgi:hypothetical protein